MFSELALIIIWHLTMPSNTYSYTKWNYNRLKWQRLKKKIKIQLNKFETPNSGSYKILRVFLFLFYMYVCFFKFLNGSPILNIFLPVISVSAHGPIFILAQDISLSNLFLIFIGFNTCTEGYHQTVNVKKKPLKTVLIIYC